jgi:hypothetical protein
MHLTRDWLLAVVWVPILIFLIAVVAVTVLGILHYVEA